MKVPQLRDEAKRRGIKGCVSKMTKAVLLQHLTESVVPLKPLTTKRLGAKKANRIRMIGKTPKTTIAKIEVPLSLPRPPIVPTMNPVPPSIEVPLPLPRPPIVPTMNPVVPSNEVVCVEKKRRVRDKAGENETKDIRAIVAAINERTPAGVKICDAFQQRFAGSSLLAARERPGNRGVHYDFDIQVALPSAEGLEPTTTWFHVEHKGSQQYAPISPTQTPWSAGVQFHNGGCEKYLIAQLYARTWYDVHVGSGALKAEFGVEAPIPSYEEWFAGDAKAQANPRTPFGIQLKNRVRFLRKARASLLDKREMAHAAFAPTADDMECFKQEVLRVLNSVLEAKDYWLTIHGDVTGEFHCAWYPKFTISEIKSLTMRKELDIWFDFDCGDIRFSSILRWGKGAGFSNLRIDARDYGAAE